jgi:hypothetical protein
MTPPPAAQTRFSDWPFAAKSILGFWFFYTLTVIARAFLGTDPLTALENKLVVLGIGIILTGLVYAAIAGFGSRSNIRRKAVIAAIASTIASLIMAGALTVLEDQMRPARSNSESRHARAGPLSSKAIKSGSSARRRNLWS